MDDWQKIGIGLIIVSLLFYILGILLIFDRGFLAMATILFLFGEILYTGLTTTLSFYFNVFDSPSPNGKYIINKSKLRNTILFFLGFIFILFRKVVFGFLLQLFGAVPLFASLIPDLIGGISHFIPGVSYLSSILRLNGGGGPLLG